MIAALLPMLLPILGKVLDRAIPDRAEAERAKAELDAELQAAVLDAAAAQVEVNKVEAAHGSIFVAGWRPAVGWVCAIGFAMAVLVLPLASVVVAVQRGEPMPEFPTEILMVVLLGMLGLGGLRSYEKVKGVTVNMPGSVQPAEVAVAKESARAISAEELNAASLVRARSGR